MKQNGFKNEFTGDVEGSASNGCQIMPPTISTAAFLMVEYSSEQYCFIALRVILPAFLYFDGIFLSVHI
jgi:TRAP-type uncharacterized transport system fused permease subunit